MTRLFIPILAICAAVFAALGAGANAEHDGNPHPLGACPRGGNFEQVGAPTGSRVDRNADTYMCSNGNANIDNRLRLP